MALFVKTCRAIRRNDLGGVNSDTYDSDGSDGVEGHP